MHCNTSDSQNGFRRRHHCVNNLEVLQFLHQPHWTSTAAVGALSGEWKPAESVQTQHGGMQKLTASTVSCGKAVLTCNLCTDWLVFCFSCWKQQRGFTLRIATFSWTRRRSTWSWVTSELDLNWRRLLLTVHGTWRYRSHILTHIISEYMYMVTIHIKALHRFSTQDFFPQHSYPISHELISVREDME